MVTLITAPAHPHATGVAVYPAVSGEIKWAGRLGSNESRVIGKTILMLLHTSCCILAVRNRLSQTGCCTPAVANWSCTPVVAYQLLHTGYCTLTFAYSTFRANSTKTGEWIFVTLISLASYLVSKLVKGHLILRIYLAVKKQGQHLTVACGC